MKPRKVSRRRHASKSESPKRRRRRNRSQDEDTFSRDDFTYYAHKRRDRLLVNRLRKEVAKLRQEHAASAFNADGIDEEMLAHQPPSNPSKAPPNADLAEVKSMLEDLHRELRAVKQSAGIDELLHDLAHPTDIYPEQGRPQSRQDRMAGRARERRARAARETKAYEESRRRSVLAAEEEAYKREKSRRERLRQREEERKRKRVEELQAEFQKEWAAALARQQDSVVAMRSRPIVVSAFQPDEEGFAGKGRSKGEGTVHVTFQEVFVHQKEGGKTKYVVRTSLLPWGDMALLKLEDFVPGHQCSFSYRGKPPSRVIPALRLELHKQEGKSGVMVGAAEVYLTKYLEDPHVEIQEQVALSNGTGIINLLLRFENNQLGGSPQHMPSPKSRLAYALPGKVRVRLLEARDLHFGNWEDAKVQINFKVSFTLKPWGIVVDSVPLANTGPNPQWRSKDAVLEFNYPGAPPRGMPPSFHIRAFNVSKTSQVEMGAAELSLCNLVSLQFENQNSRVELISSSGDMAGLLFFQVGFSAADPRKPSADVVFPTQPLFPNQPQRKPSKRNEIRRAIKERSEYIRRGRSPMSLFVDTSSDFWMKKPTEDDLNLMAQRGELRLHLLEANNLRKLHKIMYQNIVVSAVLRPWGQSYRCKAKHEGGHNHSWTEEDGVIYMDYPGVPSDKDWPMVEIEVLYSSMIKETVVARARLSLFDFLSKSFNDKTLVQESTAFLKDKTGEAAGSLTLSLSWNVARSPLNSPHVKSPVQIKPVPAISLPDTSSPKELCFVGTLQVRAIAGYHLKHVQRIGRQDPYTSVTLLPWGERARCKTHSSGGSEPRWNGKDGEMTFSYPGAPENGTLPALRIEVYDAEAVMKDRLIGHCEYPLVEFTPSEHKSMEKVVNMHLKDAAGLGAGTLDLGLKWIQYDIQEQFTAHDKQAYTLLEDTKGKLKIRILDATNLKSVQKIGKQDPYVEATLIPANVTKRSKTMWKGGTNPKWDEVGGALAFDINAKAGTSAPKFVLQVKDAEHIFHDRSIGVGHLELQTLISSSYDDKRVSIPLFDSSGGNAGALNVRLCFEKASAAEEKKKKEQKEELAKLSGYLRLSQIHLELNNRIVDVLDTKTTSIEARLEPWETKASFEIGSDGARTNLMTLVYGGAVPEKLTAPRLVLDVKVNGASTIDSMGKGVEGKATMNLERFLQEQREEERLMEASVYLDGSDTKCGKVKLAISFLSKLEEPVQRFNKITAFVERAYGLSQPLYLRARKMHPYVKLTLLESDTSVRTKAFTPSKEKSGKGEVVKDASWNTHLELTAQSHDAKLQVEVRDDSRHMLAADRLIGRAVLELDKDPPKNDIELKDAKGRRAGTLGIKLDWQKSKHQSCESWVRVIMHDAQDLLPYNFDLDRHECTLSLRPHGPFICKIPGVVSNGKVAWETQPRELWCMDGSLAGIREQTLHVLITVDKVGVVGELNLDLSLLPVWPASHGAQYLKQCTRWYHVEAREMNVDMSPQVQLSVLLLRKDNLRDQRRSSAATLIQSLRRGHSSRRRAKKLHNRRRDLENLDSLAMDALVRATKSNQEQARAALNIQRIVRGSLVRKKLNFQRAVRVIVRFQRMVKTKKARWRKRIVEGQLVVKVVRAWELRNANLIGQQDPYMRLTLEPGHIVQCTKPVKSGGRAPQWDEEKHASMVVFDIGSHPLQTSYGGPLTLSVELLTKHTMGIKSDRMIGQCLLEEDVAEVMHATHEPLKEKCIHAALKDKSGKKQVGTVELFLYWTRKVFDGFQMDEGKGPKTLKRSELIKEIRLAHERVKTLLFQANERKEAARNPTVSSVDRSRLKEEALQLETMAEEELKRANALERLYAGQGFAEAGGSRPSVMQASVDVQRVFRGSSARNKLHRDKADMASVKLQARFRGKSARSRYMLIKRKNSASELVQKVYRGSKARRNYFSLKDRRRKASVDLQRVYRGKRCRNSFQARRQEVEKLFGKDGTVKDAAVGSNEKPAENQKELIHLLDEEANNALADVDHEYEEKESVGENGVLNDIVYEEHKARSGGGGVIGAAVSNHSKSEILRVRLIGSITFQSEAAQQTYKPYLKTTLFPGAAESTLDPNGRANDREPYISTVLVLPEDRDDDHWPR